MPGRASLFHMHALLESDYAILTYILLFFAVCRGPKWGGMAQYSCPKYVPGCVSLNGHSVLVTAWNHSTSVFERCGLLMLNFLYTFMIKYISMFWLVLRRRLVAKNKNLTGFSTDLTGQSKTFDPTGNPTGRSTRPVSISEPTRYTIFGEMYQTKEKDNLIKVN